jgi:hypothetical protein
VRARILCDLITKKAEICHSVIFGDFEHFADEGPFEPINLHAIHRHQPVSQLHAGIAANKTKRWRRAHTPP